MRRIGEVAAAVGLNPKTLRYYEEIGLLPPPPRTATGYRLYDEEAAERLRFILQARAVGLTLEEISEIMRLRGDGQEPCAHVLALLDRKLMAIEAQLRTLAEARDELVALRQVARETVQCDGRICGIIERHHSARQGSRTGPAPLRNARRRPALPVDGKL